MKRLTLLFAVVLATGCGSPKGDRAQEQPIPAQEGQVQKTLELAPDFELPTLDGQTYKLSSRRGQVVIVNFWATWCGPCVRETPAFVALQEEWAERPFEIVGVSLDDEGFDIIRPFAERYEINYPMVLDDGALADAYGGVYAMPSSFIIDKEGRLIHRVVGEFPFEDLRDELETLIGA